jgi:hypothetical protein
MANIELDGANKKIKVDSGDLTLDVPGDIILDADGADLVFADGGTNILKVTNSSSDVVLQPQVDAKDIIFKQYDGTTVATVEDNGTFNVPTDKLAINGTAVTATAAEINLIDGGTARGTTAIADGDGVLINDAGTMRQTTVETLKTYIGGGDNTPSFSVRNASDQAGINTNSATKITFDTEDVDTDSAFASDKFTVPSGAAGKYFLTSSLTIEADSGVSNLRSIDLLIYKNGSNYDSTQVSTDYRNNYNHTGAVSMSLILDLSVSDYIEIYVKVLDEADGNDSIAKGKKCVFGGFKLA